MSSAPGEQPSGSNRIVCGVCGILLGGFGVHKFILGMTSTGIIQIVISSLDLLHDRTDHRPD